MMHQRIGIVSWGTKRGVEFFFNSDNIDSQSPNVKKALSDIRTVIGFNDPHIDFYSIKVLGSFKIFTQYRSVYDWTNRSGGFLAISLFVPLDTDLDSNDSILGLLNRLIGIYKDKYMDNSRISTVREDPALFLNVIQSAPWKSISKKKWETSPANAKRALVKYQNNNELKAYLSDPLRKEYNTFQEVIFLETSVAAKYRFESLDVLNVPPFVKRFNLSFKVLNENNGPINDASIKISINGESFDHPSHALVEDLRESDL